MEGNRSIADGNCCNRDSYSLWIRPQPTEYYASAVHRRRCSHANLQPVPAQTKTLPRKTGVTSPGKQVSPQPLNGGLLVKWRFNNSWLLLEICAGSTLAAKKGGLREGFVPFSNSIPLQFGPGVPSDQSCTTTIMIVTRASASFAAMTGESG